jgi:prepilin-type N-terminal cleavage/methylation domain-containing protein
MARLNSGFTLIELLVVIAVTAILASLLLPSLSRAKLSAEAAVCKSNLRQVGLGLQMYLGDFHSYPSWIYITRNPVRILQHGGHDWRFALDDYTGAKLEAFSPVWLEYREATVLACISHH